MENLPSLSIVSTIYKSEETIIKFIRKMSNSGFKIFGEDYEFILVNDCSPDNCLDLAIKESKKQKNIKIIDLSRNFGHHKAIMTGLAYASGNLVFLIE